MVLAPGTGLGEAFLVRTGGDYQAYPSEGVHVDFAPTGSEGQALLGAAVFCRNSTEKSSP
ncbi:glucokinase [Syntrophus gentianae]|uniref:glucokinase n=1 Tax=Syntrophus gentianae TaxID=43775 RepID=UPI000B27A7B1